MNLCNTLLKLLLIIDFYQNHLLHTVSSFQPPHARGRYFSSATNNVLGPPNIVLPGGGIFFYWQAGAITFIREKYDLTNVTLTGASAGALAATLTATNVDFVEATTLALELCDEYRVWERRGGLRGVWGPIIQDWLRILLPEEAAEMTKDKLCLLITPCRPCLGKERITQFNSKEDLIFCNMASVHLPLFLDGRFASKYRNRSYIDGSFLAFKRDYHFPRSRKNVLWLDWKIDPFLANKGLVDFIKTASKDFIWDLFSMGHQYAEYMDKRGDFHYLVKR